MRAGLLARGNQPLGLEVGQRLADRGAADVELRGEFDLPRQRPAFLPHAGDDQLGDLARDMGVGLAQFVSPRRFRPLDAELYCLLYCDLSSIPIVFTAILEPYPF